MEEGIAVLEDVSRVYERERVVALQNVSLRVRRGEFLAVVGPSGSGKSTLLHVLSGMDLPTSGRIFFEGCDPNASGGWGRLRAERIGFVFQAFYLLPTLTALENVQVPMFGVIRGAGKRCRRALGLLDRVGLADRAGHRPSDLSGGERQRVAIARSLANSPSMILADEPTGNLDSRTSEGIMNLLQGIQAEEGMTLILVTHNSAVAARASRLVHLSDGQVAADPRGEG